MKQVPLFNIEELEQADLMFLLFNNPTNLASAIGIVAACLDVLQISEAAILEEGDKDKESVQLEEEENRRKKAMNNCFLRLWNADPLLRVADPLFPSLGDCNNKLFTLHKKMPLSLLEDKEYEDMEQGGEAREEATLGFNIHFSGQPMIPQGQPQASNFP
eukprot:Gb_21470 [translate_table: standard]